MASVAIMSNLAEGFERGGRAEIHQFVVIAKGSCMEVSRLLGVLRASIHMLLSSDLSTQSFVFSLSPVFLSGSMTKSHEGPYFCV